MSTTNTKAMKLSNLAEELLKKGVNEEAVEALKRSMRLSSGDDMKSYFELGKQPKGVTDCASDPKFYAVSLFKSLDMLKQCLKFPRPNKKVAQGYVYMEGGPQYSEGKSHVNWWLYEDVSFDNFVIKEDNYE